MARDVRDARVPRRPRMAESGPQGAQIGLEVIKPARRRERARLAAAYRSFRPETRDEADVGNRQFHGGVSQQQEGCIYLARLEALVGETPEVEGDAGGRS